MVVEVNTTVGWQAKLLSLRVIKSIVAIMLEDTFDRSGILEEPILNQISILIGGHHMAELLQSADRPESKEHIYIVAKNRFDARAVEQAILYWVQNTECLMIALKQLESDFNDPDWEGYLFESIVADITDILAGVTMVFPGEAPQKCFRGNTSWIEQ